MIWLLFDQLYVSPLERTESRDSFHLGVHRWGTCKWPHDAVPAPTHPYPSWYALSLLSRYLGGGGGTQVLSADSDSGIVVAATKTGSRDYAVLVINTGDVDGKFQLAFSSPVRRPLFRYTYSPDKVTPAEDARLIGYDRAFDKSGNGLKASLPGRSFAVYTTVRGDRAGG